MLAASKGPPFARPNAGRNAPAQSSCAPSALSCLPSKSGPRSLQFPAHAHAHAQLRTRSSWALDQPTSAGSIFDLPRIFLCPRDVLGTPTTEGVAKVRRVSSQPQGRQPSAVLMRAKATSKRPDRRRCHATAAKRQQWLARFQAPFGATASAAAPHAPNEKAVCPGTVRSAHSSQAKAAHACKEECRQEAAGSRPRASGSVPTPHFPPAPSSATPGKQPPCTAMCPGPTNFPMPSASALRPRGDCPKPHQRCLKLWPLCATRLPT